MSDLIFLRVKGFVHAYKEESKAVACEECLKEAEERAESLGLDKDSLESHCDDLCSESVLESKNLETEEVLIKVSDIVNIAEANDGRAIIQTSADLLPRLFKDNYKDIVERLTSVGHITII